MTTRPITLPAPPQPTRMSSDQSYLGFTTEQLHIFARDAVLADRAASIPPDARRDGGFALVCCPKHMGQQFTVAVAYAPQLRSVCPHCDPDYMTKFSASISATPPAAPILPDVAKMVEEAIRELVALKRLKDSAERESSAHERALTLDDYRKRKVLAWPAAFKAVEALNAQEQHGTNSKVAPQVGWPDAGTDRDSGGPGANLGNEHRSASTGSDRHPGYSLGDCVRLPDAAALRESIDLTPVAEQLDEFTRVGRLAAVTQARVSQEPVALKEKLTDIIAAGLAGTYHCGRVWQAWNVGTMSEDDFSPVEESDTPAELADAVIAALYTSPQPSQEPAVQHAENKETK